MAAADAAPPLPQYDDFEETENHDGSFAPGDGTATGGGGNATRQVGEISKGRVCALALAALEASILPFPDARRLEKRLVFSRKCARSERERIGPGRKLGIRVVDLLRSKIS